MSIAVALCLACTMALPVHIARHRCLHVFRIYYSAFWLINNFISMIALQLTTSYCVCVYVCVTCLNLYFDTGHPENNGHPKYQIVFRCYLFVHATPPETTNPKNQKTNQINKQKPQLNLFTKAHGKLSNFAWFV